MIQWLISDGSKKGMIHSQQCVIIGLLEFYLHKSLRHYNWQNWKHLETSGNCSIACFVREKIQKGAFSFTWVAGWDVDFG